MPSQTGRKSLFLKSFFSSVGAPTIVKVKTLLQDQLSEHNTPLTLSGTVEETDVTRRDMNH